MNSIEKHKRISKTICIVALVFLFSSCSANKTSEKPATNTIIGKEFSDFTEIDPGFQVGQFASLYTDQKYGVTVGGQRGFERVWHVYFTFIVGYNGNNPRYRLLDSIIVDLRKRENVQLTLGSCECRTKTEDCLSIAVYDRQAPRGQNQPDQVWLPDLKKRKFVSIAPSELDCESEADITDEP